MTISWQHIRRAIELRSEYVGRERGAARTRGRAFIILVIYFRQWRAEASRLLYAVAHPAHPDRTAATIPPPAAARARKTPAGYTRRRCRARYARTPRRTVASDPRH